MGIPDGAHTHGGGSGPGELVGILLAVALLGPAVAAAVAELLHLLVIVIMVLAALRAACLAGLLVLRARRRLESAALAVAPNLGAVSPLHRTERAASPLPRAQGPPVPPIESGREVSGGVSSSRPRRECGRRRRPPRLGPAATRCKPARAAARPMTPAARGGPRGPGGAAGSPTLTREEFRAAWQGDHAREPAKAHRPPHAGEAVAPRSAVFGRDAAAGLGGRGHCYRLLPGRRIRAVTAAHAGAGTTPADAPR